MKNKPRIGERVFMPKKPTDYLSARHPVGERAGIVVSHPQIFSDCVYVLFDETKKKPKKEEFVLYKWLLPEIIKQV